MVHDRELWELVVPGVVGAKLIDFEDEMMQWGIYSYVDKQYHGRTFYRFTSDVYQAREHVMKVAATHFPKEHIWCWRVAQTALEKEPELDINEI